jgi:hypothetical protein
MSSDETTIERDESSKMHTVPGPDDGPKPTQTPDDADTEAHRYHGAAIPDDADTEAHRFHGTAIPEEG